MINHDFQIPVERGIFCILPMSDVYRCHTTTSMDLFSLFMYMPIVRWSQSPLSNVNRHGEQKYGTSGVTDPVDSQTVNPKEMFLTVLHLDPPWIMFAVSSGVFTSFITNTQALALQNVPCIYICSKTEHLHFSVCIISKHNFQYFLNKTKLAFIFW